METQEPKDIRPRSKLYPRYDLEEMMFLIHSLEKLGGNKVSQDAVAASMSKATNNSTFIGRISSAKQFGLITQENGKLSLTTIGREILYPRDETSKKAAIMSAFQSPPLYGQLIGTFKGRTLPDKNTLGNRLLHDFFIEATARELAAKNFIQSAEFAGAVSNGILVIDTDPQNAQYFNDLPAEKEPYSETPKAIVRDSDVFEFEFAGNIRLIIPKNSRTSDAIADGELKEIRKGLTEFAVKFMGSESESH